MKYEYIYTINENCDNKIENSFCVKKDIDNLYIDIDIEEKFSLMIYVVAIDSNGVIRMQKQLGYGEKTLLISSSSNTTSIGGYAGPIVKGEWKLIVYIFKEYLVQLLDGKTFNFSIYVSDKCDKKVSQTIGEESWTNYKLEKGKITYNNYNWNKVINDKERWYKGDFHTHTVLSDGKETVKNAMKKARNMKLDFYVPTEHNLIHTGWPKTEVLAIPGIEITTSYGHLNIFGINEIPNSILDIAENVDNKEFLEKEINDLLENNYKNNYINSINHPFLSVWRWKYRNIDLRYINTLEIINDPTYMDAKVANDMAIKFIDLLWNNGHKIYGVGGSDSHNLIDERYDGADKPSIPGDPSTYVFCNKLTANNILDSVRSGNVYVTRGLKLETEIKVGSETYMPGDRINICLNKEIHYRCKIIPEENITIKIYIVINGEKTLINHKLKENEFFIDYIHEIENEEYTWIRLEIRDEEDNFLGYINPIYYGRKEPNKITYGEMLDEMEQLNEN